MKTSGKYIFITCLFGVLVLGLSLFCWFKTPNEYSQSERRVLAQFPELTGETLLSGDFMADFETYTQDQFPGRESFRTLKAATSLFLFQQKDNNKLYLADGHVSKVEYPLNEASLTYAVDRFNYIHDTYLAGTDANVYLSIVPDKNYFLAEPNGYLALDYDALIDTVKAGVPYMAYIDITQLLALEDYYNTDTHWRQENILPVAETLAAQMGVPFDDSYQINTLPTPFYGVYHGQSALPLSPDTIRYLTSDLLEGCIITSYDTGKPVQKPLYDMEKAVGKDPYEMFLSGSDALITVENPHADTDRELILFRDSYGSSLAPLLMPGYAKITLVDIRYIQSGMLGHFIEVDDQDVLFLYSAILLNNSFAFK